MKGLYLVTDRSLLAGKTLDDVVIQAVKAGVSAIQLREKEASTRFFIEEAQRIKKVLASYKVPLIINDRVDVALAAGADGVHIGQEDMPYPLARKILGKNMIIGLSVERVEQVIEAESYDVDYLGVSAVFATPTKVDIKYNWGLNGLREVRKISRHLLVAIGGINSSNILDVVRAGADSVAVVSAICSAANPYQAALTLNQVFQ